MEEWKQTEHPDYWVSNLGRVKSCKYGKERILKPALNKSGYTYAHFSYNHRSIMALVHCLVGKAFIPNPLNLPFIDHINRIKTDNRVENLRWVTHSQNLINTPDRTNNRHIYKVKNGWKVVINRNSKQVYYVQCDSIEDAQVNRTIWLLFQ